VAGGQVGEREGADAGTDEVKDGMANGGEHAAHLAFAPLVDAEGEPAIFLEL
jgi:hypothetical protein